MASPLLAAGVAASCGSSLPRPAQGPPPPASAYVEVPFPPPPGNVEIVPPRPPDREAVWIDGQWSAYSRERFVWQPGAWVRPPEGAVFTAWKSERRADGQVYFAPPAWRGKDGAEIAAPPALALARRGEPSSGGVTSDDERLGRPTATGDAGPPPGRPEPLLTDAGLEPQRFTPDERLPSPPALDASRGPDAMPSVDAGGGAR